MPTPAREEQLLGSGWGAHSTPAARRVRALWPQHTPNGSETNHKRLSPQPTQKKVGAEKKPASVDLAGFFS